jgi:nitrate reductase delta subunit
MDIALKVISLLLSYPTEEFRQSEPDIVAAVAADQGVTERQKVLISRLVEDIARRDLYDAQERYVYLFDRTRSLSLHLFEHVHGESRDRGQAMVDLMAMYEADGFSISARELPDYLPLFLEYLSTKEPAEAAHLLGQTSHILTVLKERLKKRKSIYANAFAVLETLAREKPDRALLDQMMSQPEDDPDDLAALDSIWEEEAVTFGGNAGEAKCGPDRLRTRMRAAARQPGDQPNTAIRMEP